MLWFVSYGVAWSLESRSLILYFSLPRELLPALLHVPFSLPIHFISQWTLSGCEPHWSEILLSIPWSQVYKQCCKLQGPMGMAPNLRAQECQGVEAINMCGMDSTRNAITLWTHIKVERRLTYTYTLFFFFPILRCCHLSSCYHLSPRMLRAFFSQDDI